MGGAASASGGSIEQKEDKGITNSPQLQMVIL